MKERKYCVYIHTTPSNKVYIGITCRSPKKRWGNGNNYKNNIHFTNAIKKYGWKNIKHEVLFKNLSKEEAEQKEKDLIAKYKSNQREYGYNKSIGGEHSALGFHHTEKAKKIIAEKLRVINLGNHLTDETKDKIRKARLGKAMKLETKIKKSKPVICIETNTIYYGIYEAYIQTGINASNIGSCAKGKRKKSRWI